VEDTLNLSPTDLKLIKNDKGLKRFCVDADLETRLLLLSKVGIRFSLNMMAENMDKSAVKNFYKQYQKDGNRAEIIESMAANKFFVLSSFQMVLASFYLHQNCQSDYYILNRSFQKMAMIKQVVGKKPVRFQQQEDLRDIEEGAKFLIEVCFQLQRHHGIFQAFGLKHKIDLQILLLLARKKNSSRFVEDKMLFNECNDGHVQKKSFTQRLSALYKEGFIEKMPGDKYAICDKGIYVVMQVMKKMVELIQFDI
jgi:hypothetical protein